MWLAKTARVTSNSWYQKQFNKSVRNLNRKVKHQATVGDTFITLELSEGSWSTPGVSGTDEVISVPHASIDRVKNYYKSMGYSVLQDKLTIKIGW